MIAPWPRRKAAPSTAGRPVAKNGNPDGAECYRQPARRPFARPASASAPAGVASAGRSRRLPFSKPNSAGMTNASRLLVLALAACFAVAEGSCLQKSDLFCCTTEASCAAKNAPFPTLCDPGFVCDETGALNPIKYTCVASGQTCTGPAQCTDPTRPECLTDGTCGCTNDGTCPASAPSCNGVARACTGCETNADCQRLADTPRCDIASGSCVSCQDGADCPSSDAPVCSAEGECTGCLVAEDCSRFPDASYCEASSGRCLACLENQHCPTPTAPVCDNGACRACRADGDCLSGICDEAAGSCAAEDNIIYVSPNGRAGDCTRTAPCATINQGLARISPTRSTVLVLPKTGGYREQVSITDESVTIVGAGAEVSPPTADAGPAITILRSSVVVLEGLRVTGAHSDLDRDGDGIQCLRAGGDRPLVTLRNVTIFGNARRGIDASDCTLTVERATVEANKGGGLQAVSSLVKVTNSAFLGNGTSSGVDATLFGGVHYERPVAGSTFDFNTVSNGLAGGSNPRGVRCTVATGTVTVSNSIVVGAAATQLGADCLPRYVLSNQDLAGRGVGNVQGTPTFTSDGVHLAPGSAGIDAGDPDATASFDIDGDARPLPIGGRRDIGADEVRP
jgi:hypothetical protein